MPLFNWMELRKAGVFCAELDPIEAALIVEAAQSHAIVLARKREAIESSKEPGRFHMLALLDADSRALNEVATRIDRQLSRELAVERSREDGAELFRAVAPIKKGRAA